jgi:hypothetical protein
MGFVTASVNFTILPIFVNTVGENIEIQSKLQSFN